ncbi:hypothetical protein CC80DRAFT_537956 [Byssothecium circinans]|uniref:Zn(2)-C6 fungal-type domain-containing protein n=1 Tax=Byssothecium circinans TaxID=147558 RepID=A0A6A5TKK5_9PLEO|nr:hypothetical protein CC80DRAFT_537956 [Byssothecium circinans]
MSESAHVLSHPRTTSTSSENFHGAVEQTAASAEGTRRRQSSQQPRQLLSCTKCRERKVKCDRIKPCSACCARGASKECYFIAEGGDYAPIQQSYELRKLRAENLRLKERLRASKIPIEDDDSETASPESLSGERPTSSAYKRRAARQRRFQGSEWADSVYFGSPGLANVITDFANINLAPMSTQSLAHLMPRGPEMYTTETPPPYPFATMFPHTPDECIPELLSCLHLEEAKDELLQDLESFEKRVHICAFPYVPMEITKSEVERFLAEPVKNATMCPDMLALLFAALALGSQHSAWDKGGGRWEAGAMERELRKGDVYKRTVAAAMQALRLASFMHKPTLLGIQALIMMGPFLTNSGRFLDAWTLFGTTIRLAHSIGLHRHPKYLDPAPPTQTECFIRQTLWWWMLHMDTEYSMTLGRPLGISGIGDCPPPQELTTDPHMLRFGEFVSRFTVLARQILSSNRMTNAKIDEFTDALRGLLETMPDVLQFDETWADEEKEIPEWPLGAMAAVFYCKTHTYLILLNRQRIEKHPNPPLHYAQTPQNLYQTSTSFSSPTQQLHQSPSPKSPLQPILLRGRSLVLSSSSDLLTAFLFFHARVPTTLICWTMGQQAFNSCMILLLDAMETWTLERIDKVEKAYVVFLQLQRDGVHGLAGMAVDRISWGLARLGRMRGGGAGNETVKPDEKIQDTVMGSTGMLLLEDPGLQAFVPEAFQPFAWDQKLWNAHSITTMEMKHVKQETDRERKQGDESVGAREGGVVGGGEMVRSRCDDLGGRYDVRSSGRVLPGAQSRGSETLFGSAQQQPQRQQRSHPQRYATQQQMQAQTRAQAFELPQGPRSSPHTLRQGSETGTSRAAPAELHQLPPPHLRHHSYPSLRQPVAPLGRGAHHRLDLSPPEMGIPDHHLSPGMPTSQPHIHAHTHTHLSTLPECTTIPAAASTAYSNPNVHPSWAARPAAPLSSLSEPAVGFEDVARAQMSPQTDAGWRFGMPFHGSSADGAGDGVERSMPPVSAGEDMFLDAEGWRR